MEEKLSPEISHQENANQYPVLDRVDSLDAPSLGGSVQNEEIEPQVGVLTWLVVLSCSLGWMSIVWTLVAIGLQQASLVALVRGDPKNGVWIQNAATTVTVVLSVPIARMSDNIGRKYLILGCQAIGVIGTFLIGGATSLGMAIAGSCLYGVMFSIGPLLYAIPAEILPRRYRGIANCCANFGSTSGGILAGVAGQRISTFTVGGVPGTRWAFYLPALLQTKLRKDGLFHHKMFNHRNFPLALVCIFTEGIFYYVFNAYYGAQTGLLYTQSPEGIGFRFACFFFPQLPLYVIVGYVTARIRKFKACIVAGFVIFLGAMIVS
ncbi:hypothetical protein RQP46_008362 [Phenoliferia psychrophenolica]